MVIVNPLDVRIGNGCPGLASIVRPKYAVELRMTLTDPPAGSKWPEVLRQVIDLLDYAERIDDEVVILGGASI